MTDDIFTYKDRLASLRAREAEQRAQRIAEWRARWPESTCSDATAMALMEIEAGGRRQETT